MQYCQKCRVIIHGGKACCPLCQAPLSGDPEPDVFPALKHKTFSAVMIARIVSFILVSWLVVLAAIITPTGDLFTLSVVFLPLYILYEASALLVPKGTEALNITTKEEET